jgi:hypothetical protein
MPHVEDGQLHALLDAALADAEARALHEHLTNCAECAARLAETRSLRARSAAILAGAQPAAAAIPPFEVVLEKAQQPAAGQRSVWSLPMASLARAAMVVLALGIGWFSRDLTQRAAQLNQPQQARLDAAAPEVPAPAPPAPAESLSKKAAPPGDPALADERKENAAGSSGRAAPPAEAVGRDEQQQSALAAAKTSGESANVLRRPVASGNAGAQSQMQTQTQQQSLGQMQAQLQQRQAALQEQVAATPPPAAPAGQRALMDAVSAPLRWQFMSLDRAEQMVGRRVLRVPGLEVINVGVAEDNGGRVVLTRQRLADQGVLELLHRPAANQVTDLVVTGAAEGRRTRAQSNEIRVEAESDDVGSSVLTLHRPDGTLTARAFLEPDSLRALLLRVN